MIGRAWWRGPVRVNSNRWDGSETVTWRSWNDDERHVAHAKLRQLQREKWNQERHSRFKNQAATCSTFWQKKLHFTTKYWQPTVLLMNTIIRVSGTELRERIYVNKHSIVKHFQYRYEWLWTKIWQQHVNLPKLRRGKVWNSDGGNKDPP